MSIAERYGHAIGAFIRYCGGPDKFAHTYVGLTLWLVIGFALRRPMRSPVPAMIVLALEIANEIMDRIVQGYVDWPDAAGDFIATLFWPTILTLVAWRAHATAPGTQIDGTP